MNDKAVFHNPILRDGFAQTPNVILYTGSLSLQEKAMYMLLLSYAWHNPEAFPAQDTLSQDSKISIRQVRNILKDLEKKKLIMIERQGFNRPNIYHFLDFTQTRKDIVAEYQAKIMERKSIAGPDRQPNSSPVRKSIAGQERKSVSDEQQTGDQYSKKEQPQELFQNLHFSKSEGQKIINNYPTGRIQEVIEASGRVESFKTSREAWIISALKDNWDVRPEEKRQEEERQQRREQEQQEQRRREKEEEQNRARVQILNTWIEEHPDQWEFLKEKAKTEVPAILSSSETAINAKARTYLPQIIDGEMSFEDILQDPETENNPEESSAGIAGFQVRGVGA